MVDLFYFAAICELGVDSIETLLISVPENQDNGERSLKKLRMMWEVIINEY